MKPVKALLLFLLLVPAFNLLTVWVLPTAINKLVLHRIVQKGLQEAAIADPDPAVQARKAERIARHGINVALPAGRADATARTVVRPSPDLLYTACVFDLSHSPLHITAPVQISYVSISGFAADSSNFFAVNDGDAVVAADGSKRLELVLTRAGQTANVPGARVLLSPSTRGLILFRSLILDEASLPLLRSRYQAEQRCEPLS